MFHVYDVEKVKYSRKVKFSEYSVARILRCIQLHSFYYEVPEGISRPTNVSLLQDAR